LFAWAEVMYLLSPNEQELLCRSLGFYLLSYLVLFNLSTWLQGLLPLLDSKLPPNKEHIKGWGRLLSVYKFRVHSFL